MIVSEAEMEGWITGNFNKPERDSRGALDDCFSCQTDLMSSTSLIFNVRLQVAELDHSRMDS